jgi:ketosteroid isomerase-like protein
MTKLDEYRALFERGLDAYNRRDPDGFLAMWLPNCEWHPFLTARVEGDPGYHGHNGLRAWFEDVDEMFSAVHGELDEVREAGERYVALGQMRATGRGSGEEVTSEIGWVFEMEGDLCRRGWAYTTHDKALEAAVESA